MDASDLQSLALPESRKAWFVNDRFGLFIHFGLYALPARHEWIKNFEELTDDDYQPYFDNFDPDLYDPVAWAKCARAAGMKYVVLTTKHHEGFCLWDTKATDYKVTNTPYGNDLLGPFVEAFRAEGLRVGFYYSLLDWHHPDFTVDPRHPQRNHPDAAALNQARDGRRYAEYMREQVRELLTWFGKIDIMWFDFSYADWMAVHARSIHGCTQSQYTAPPDCRLTQNGNRLYLHIFNWPFRHLHFDAIAGKVDYAQFLHDGSEVSWLKPGPGAPHSNTRLAVSDDMLTFMLPVRRPPVTVPVIEIFLKE